MQPILIEERARERAKYAGLIGTGYGEKIHGRLAVNLVASWRPQVVVDIGCGSNGWAQLVRAACPKSEVLGVDFVNPAADVLAPAHDTGLPSDYADVVTSFDMLEHLLQAEVDDVFKEMARIAKPGGRFVFSISYVPSRITSPEGEPLHMTVQPPEWWVERIERVGELDAHQGRYVTGRFKPR